MQQFYAEFRRNDLEAAQIATLPMSYAQGPRRLEPVNYQWATFLGDTNGDRQPDWVVGFYLPPRPREKVPPPPAGPAMGSGIPALDERARLAVFQQDAEKRWRLTWTSPGLGMTFDVPRYNLLEVEDGLAAPDSVLPPLSLSDVDGDRRLEIVYHCRSQSHEVQSLPGIFRFDGTRWANVAPQADRFSVKDLNGDGKPELVTGSRYVGYGNGDDDVPRVWRWTGRYFREASAEFPAFYRDLASRYASYVRLMEARGLNINRVVWQRAIQKAASLSS